MILTALLRKIIPYETYEYSIRNGNAKVSITKPSGGILPEGSS